MEEKKQKIVLEHVSKVFKTKRQTIEALRDINISIPEREIVSIVGPSGCGKTTTLRVVAGLEKPQEGYMYMGDREIVNAPEKFYEEPGKRHLNLVFQSYALWPHMTVFDNVAFGLEVAKVPKEIGRAHV